MVAQLHESTKNHWIVHFTWLNCVVCELYLNKVNFTSIKSFLKEWPHFKRMCFPATSVHERTSLPLSPFLSHTHRCLPFCIHAGTVTVAPLGALSRSPLPTLHSIPSCCGYRLITHHTSLSRKLLLVKKKPPLPKGHTHTLRSQPQLVAQWPASLPKSGAALCECVLWGFSVGSERS